ncbi:unnamed protein product [Thlaspi arvense]|uniref:Probable magnesium transporter n=1 Tax=Thlaspi arvense TaxID=13288 RepID=A0AAU9SEI6_THLAR|nr:unnamed protein product [Thlaspi arvense]
MFGFLAYSAVVLVVVLALIFYYEPRYGKTHMIVMSVKAVAIAIKLTFSGMNQFKYFHAWIFIIVVTICCILQINYLNKDWASQSGLQIATELCGFVTILSGTFLLHKTKDMGNSGSSRGATSHTPRDTPVFINSGSTRSSNSNL